MSHEIDSATLRDWLEEARPVRLLDIRAQADREQWSIPGSIHVAAYDALKAGRAEALDNIEIPGDGPVVTICGSGRVSIVAAERLRARGIDSLSLEGGMKAWSLAWNTARVTLPRSATQVVQIRRTGKGCLSYLIASKGEALVLDASLPPEVYLRIAEQEDCAIKFVADTHVHADHLSRSPALALRTGAVYLLPKQERVRCNFEPVAEGDTFKVGDATLTAIWTPGHTRESTCYHMDDDALFTGDTLFLNGIGRPDLHAGDPGEVGRRAADLHASLNRLFALNYRLQVLPGHTNLPVAFDGRPLVAELGEVVARLNDWRTPVNEFVNRIVARIPPTPPNFARIAEINEAGGLTNDLVNLADDPTELEAGANRCAVS
jgi:glyoxylase-like metal-dependent hydrolase (beta-lactamase superfamily II)